MASTKIYQKLFAVHETEKMQVDTTIYSPQHIQQGDSNSSVTEDSALLLLILMVDAVMARPYYSGREAPVGKYNRIDSMQPRTKSFPSFAILLLSVASSDFLSGNPVFWPAFSGTQDSTNNINP